MAASNKIFSLEGKGLKLDSASDIEAHIDALKSMDDVEEVRLLGNTLGVEACKRLGEVLASKKSLKVANFADIFTGRLLSEIPDAISALLTSVLNLPNLRTVNLNDNAFGINTVTPIVAFLSSHVPLQYLYLNNNGLGPHAGILVADALSELHIKKEEAKKAGQDVPDLETIICGRNRLENGSMTAWAKTFGLHTKVKEIRMVQNGIRQDGISHLLKEGLSHLTEIKTLDLQDNTFTVKGARALVKVAPIWTEITELNVSEALFSNKGTVLLAGALSQRKNAKLELLRLQYADITTVGLKALVDCIKSGVLPSLKKVELNGNKFTEDDESILALQEYFEERKESAGGDVVDEDDWGVDSLSDLEGPDSDEEEEEDEDEEDEPTAKDVAEKLVKEAEEAQEEPTVQLKDKGVDKLADKLDKTSI